MRCGFREISLITVNNKALDRGSDCSEELLQLTPGRPKFIVLLSTLRNDKHSATIESFYLDRGVDVGETLLQEKA